jgi:hypothetical protein
VPARSSRTGIITHRNDNIRIISVRRARNEEIEFKKAKELDKKFDFADGAVTIPDPGYTVTSEKQGDSWSIGVNDFYFYLIPEAVISGG